MRTVTDRVEAALPALTVLNAVALGAVLAIVALLFESLITGLPFAPGHAARVVGSAPRCGSCGVVESVRAVTQRPPRGASTVAGGGPESVAMLLAALDGRLPRADLPAVVYEIVIRMDDGSVRALREPSRPLWQPGERVRIAQGEVRRAPVAQPPGAAFARP